MAQTDLASGSTCIHCIEESAERPPPLPPPPSSFSSCGLGHSLLVLIVVVVVFHRSITKWGKIPVPAARYVCVCWLLVASRNSTNRRVRLFSCLNSCCSYLCWRECLCVVVVWLMDCSVVVVVVVLMGVCCLRIAYRVLAMGGCNQIQNAVNYLK